ncbi:MAG: ester cyclase [Thermoleophilaceae bacterium]
MSSDRNKELVRRLYEEAWGRGELDVIDELFADEYERHDLRPLATRPGPAGQRQIAEDFRTAFPDIEMTVDLLLADGDYVVARWTGEGTNTGPWGGGGQATGRHASISGVNIFRFENGRVVEVWNHRDDLGIMEQLAAPIYSGGA